MLVNFFETLREYQLPVSIREYLDFLRLLEQEPMVAEPDTFYVLARTCMVKDEKHFDRFDRAFSTFMHGVAQLPLDADSLSAVIPADWLTPPAEAGARRKVPPFESLAVLLKAFQERLKEQVGRHQGGSKWIGTGGTSAFGHSGHHPNGIRVGGESRQRSAARVWEQRTFRNLDDTLELGTRNLKLALRRLRVFARSGAAEQLDLDDTIRSTARNGGYLDLKLMPERHNAVKVLLFLDVGGSMDVHVRTCEELFSAATSEFKHLKYFYFHNFVYGQVWTDNRRRQEHLCSTPDILHTYGSDYRVVFVGDAAMAPWEVSEPGGSLEYYNAESGQVWLQRLQAHFPRLIWLNPEPESYWEQTLSTRLIRELLGGRMYPLSLRGLEQGVAELTAPQRAAPAGRA
ncbi:MAG: VWA domain-containing protein [Thiothrix sp.]|nr:VWA domain-containing protein [Thiothrix sp.]